MSNEGYHEPIAELSDETRDMHRAIVSLMEELEAVDWYNQRVDACKDGLKQGSRLSHALRSTASSASSPRCGRARACRRCCSR